MVLVDAVLRLHSATSWTDEDAKKDVIERTCKIKTIIINWQLVTQLLEFCIKRYNSFVQESDYSDSQKKWLISIRLLVVLDDSLKITSSWESFVYESFYTGCAECYWFTEKNQLIRVICSRIRLQLVCCALHTVNEC